MICPSCLYDNVPGADACERCQFDLAPLDLPAAQNRVESSLLRDRVATILPNRPPVTVSHQATVGQAVFTMLEAQVGAVLVVDDAGQLVGIFSERDLLLKVTGVQPAFAELPVREFMTADPVTVTERDTLGFALHKMDVGGYRHLPVVAEGRPQSVLSVRDLIRHITHLCWQH